MIIWALISLTVLVDIPILAKVVNDFGECNGFFYKKTPPQGMDENSKKICQQYEHSGKYASLYSTFHRIPVYSAYIFDWSCNNADQRKTGDWYIEPGLSGIQDGQMKSEVHYTDQNVRNGLKYNQALNADYCGSGYDRGHLSPNSFQCRNGRKATFTLTNAAPMDASFNRVHWKEWENVVKTILKDQSVWGTAYLVTGTVPSRNPNYRIPRRGELDDPDEHSTEVYERVTVPTHVWTAVCYQHFINKHSFSFGYIGKNLPDSKITVMTVPELNEELSRLYGIAVNIFIDDCFSTTRKSEETVKQLYKSKEQPLSSSLGNMDVMYFSNRQADDTESIRMELVLYFDNSMTWFETTERLKYVSGLTCVQSQQFTGPVRKSSTKIQKRDTVDSQELVCSLVPEQVSGCTSSCLYRKQARGYYCYSGDTEQACSPQYSVITLSGAKCASGHTCAKKGNNYGCYTGSNVWQHCSHPLPPSRTRKGIFCRSNLNCGWYGKDYTWCYTDYNENSWDYCCINDHPSSAVSGKTCKSDHLCDYHGKSYLWCYTTDNSWDYCCTSLHVFISQSPCFFKEKKT